MKWRNSLQTGLLVSSSVYTFLFQVAWAVPLPSDKGPRTSLLTIPPHHALDSAHGVGLSPQ